MNNIGLERDDRRLGAPIHPLSPLLLSTPYLLHLFLHPYKLTSYILYPQVANSPLISYSSLLYLTSFWAEQISVPRETMKDQDDFHNTTLPGF